MRLMVLCQANQLPPCAHVPPSPPPLPLLVPQRVDECAWSCTFRYSMHVRMHAWQCGCGADQRRRGPDIFDGSRRSFDRRSGNAAHMHMHACARVRARVHTRACTEVLLKCYSRFIGCWDDCSRGPSPRRKQHLPTAYSNCGGQCRLSSGRWMEFVIALIRPKTTTSCPSTKTGMLC